MHFQQAAVAEEEQRETHLCVRWGNTSPEEKNARGAKK